MEQSTNVINFEKELHKSKESNAISVAFMSEHSAHNSNEFSHRFDSTQSAGDCDQIECDDDTTNMTAAESANVSTDIGLLPHIAKKSIAYFIHFSNKMTTVSPISELSLNDDAWKKIASTYDKMGKCNKYLITIEISCVMSHRIRTVLLHCTVNISANIVLFRITCNVQHVIQIKFHVECRQATFSTIVR